MQALHYCYYCRSIKLLEFYFKKFYLVVAVLFLWGLPGLPGALSKLLGLLKGLPGALSKIVSTALVQANKMSCLT